MSKVMVPTKVTEPGKCNVSRKGNRPCRRGAGWGTTHPGRGPCKLHGGATRNHVKRYARLDAVEQARKFLDDPELDIDPLEAALVNVRIGASLVRFQQAKMRALEQITPDDEADLREALKTSQAMNKQAIDAGIAERLINVVERAGEQIALVCEAGLAALVAAGVVLSAEQRTAYAKAIASATEGFEDVPLQLTEGADA